MKYPKLRELKEAIKALIKGPFTTKYPFEPHIPPEGFRGKPQPSQEGCIGCGACVEVCPAGAIRLLDNLECDVRHSENSGSESIVQSSEKDNKKISNYELLTRKLVWHYDECVFCGQCARLCTTRNEKIPGVVMSKEFDLSTTDRSTLRSIEIKHELIICSYCGSIISTKSHLLYIAKKLGHKTYGNINLFKVIAIKLGIISNVNVRFRQFNQREYLYEILCPKCRRKSMLFDEYGKV